MRPMLRARHKTMRKKGPSRDVNTAEEMPLSLFTFWKLTGLPWQRSLLIPCYILEENVCISFPSLTTMLICQIQMFFQTCILAPLLRSLPLVPGDLSHSDDLNSQASNPWNHEQTNLLPPSTFSLSTHHGTCLQSGSPVSPPCETHSLVPCLLRNLCPSYDSLLINAMQCNWCHPTCRTGLEDASRIPHRFPGRSAPGTARPCKTTGYLRTTRLGGSQNTHVQRLCRERGRFSQPLPDSTSRPRGQTWAPEPSGALPQQLSQDSRHIWHLSPTTWKLLRAVGERWERS